MRRTMIHLAVALTTLICLPEAEARQVGGQTQPPSRVVVTGTGTVAVDPDHAVVRFSIESRASDPAQAANDAAQRQRAALDALRSAGVPEGSVASVGYAVSPEYEFDENRNRELSGYSARSTVRVETTMLERVGELIDAALAAGVNRVDAVDFHASDVNDARREALAGAVEQARLDAEAMARAAGGRLGRLIELTIEEPAPDPGVRVRAYAPRQAQVTRITPGENQVTATVLARWEFEEG